MKVSQDVLSRGNVLAVSPSVVAGVGIHLSDEVVLVLGHDHLAAPLARHLDGHVDSMAA